MALASAQTERHSHALTLSICDPKGRKPGKGAKKRHAIARHNQSLADWKGKVSTARAQWEYAEGPRTQPNNTNHQHKPTNPNRKEPKQAHSHSTCETTGRPREGGKENMKRPYWPIRWGG